MSTDKRRFFDDVATSWDKRYCENEDVNRRLDSLVLRFRLKPGLRIMDLGCGTGVITGRLCGPAGEGGKVICCDISVKMLKLAKRKQRDSAFICSDAHYLPFKGRFFDGIISFSCFPHFDDKLKVLAEVNRVLKPGGVLIVSHLLSSSELNRMHMEVKGAVSKDMMPSREEMISSLRKTGFRVIEFHDEKGLYLLRAKKVEEKPFVSTDERKLR